MSDSNEVPKGWVSEDWVSDAQNPTPYVFMWREGGLRCRVEDGVFSTWTVVDLVTGRGEWEVHEGAGVCHAVGALLRHLFRRLEQEGR